MTHLIRYDRVRTEVAVLDVIICDTAISVLCVYVQRLSIVTMVVQNSLSGSIYTLSTISTYTFTYTHSLYTHTLYVHTPILTYVLSTFMRGSVGPYCAACLSLQRLCKTTSDGRRINYSQQLRSLHVVFLSAAIYVCVVTQLVTE
eukprot:GHVS01052743.1.p1 GENE.GHVS01052743.1~~GHVS01052743.1.p1  ORF type:complete len:145 (-),score=0.91 GHVS01052743.1:160-594(-)